MFDDCFFLRKLITCLSILLPVYGCQGGCTSPFGGHAEDRESSDQSLQPSSLKKIEAMIQQFEHRFPVPHISAKEALRKTKSAEHSSVVFVDVRENHERQVSSIPGALTKEEFLRRLSADKGTAFKGKTVIVFCTIGYRSGAFVKDLLAKKKDLTPPLDIRNLRGSLLQWTHEKGPLVDSSGKSTKRVHVYGKDWDLVPPQYEVVY